MDMALIESEKEMDNVFYAVWGVGGYGREVMPLALRQLQKLGGKKEQLFFIDDHVVEKEVNGYRVVTYQEFLELPASERFVSIAIGSSQTREKLAQKCAVDGIKPWEMIAENVVIMDQVELGEGALLSPFVTLTSNIRIGKQFQANIYSYVAHDCILGDFVTFAPGVCCNGNVVIEDHVYIGTNAVLRQGKPGEPLVIGKGAVVGMGAVVTKNVAPGTTVIGNPARLMEVRAK